MSDLLAQLQAAIQGTPEKPEKGFKTVQQWADEWNGISRPQAFRLLSKGIALGLIEKKAFKIHTGQKLYPVPHYRQKK